MNAPNTISIFRILLTPAVLFCLMWHEPNHMYWAFALFVLAAATDWLDGHIARKYQLGTTFGKFADPLADKLLVCAALIGLLAFRRMNVWFVFIILSREFIITGLRLVAVEQGTVLAATMSGKIKTVLQMVAIAWRMFDSIVLLSIAGVRFSKIMLIVATAMTVYSGAEYLWKNRALLKTAR